MILSCPVSIFTAEICSKGKFTTLICKILWESSDNMVSAGENEW